MLGLVHRSPFSLASFWVSILLGSVFLPCVVNGEESASAADPSSQEVAAATPEILATWKGGDVERELYERWLAYHKSEDQREDRKSVVEKLLIQLELAEVARSRGAEKELAFILQRFESKQLLAAYRSHLAKSIVVTEEDIAKAFRDHPKAFDLPRRVRLRNLFKRLPDGASDAEKEALRGKMTRWLEELRSGADFAELARRESDSENRLRGGRMAVVSAGQLRPEIDSMAMALKEGEWSDVLETPDGLTILWCEEILPAVIFSAEKRAARFEKNIRSLRIKEQWAAERERLLRLAEPIYDLESAFDPQADPETEIVKFRDGRVRLADLDLLLARSSMRTKRDQLQEEGMRRRLEEHAVQEMAARQAIAAGLFTAAIKERIYWRNVEILAAHEIGRRVQAKLEEPSGEELRKHFAELAEPPKRLPHYRLAAISLPVGEEIESSWRLALKLARQIRGEELAFEDAAKRYSDHPTASEGGTWGWFSRREVASLGPVAHRAIQELEPGSITDPIREAGAWWIFQVLEREAERPLTFEEAREEIHRDMIQERLRVLQEALVAELQGELKVEILEP